MSPALAGNSGGNNVATYEVTITNLAATQPVSPPVAVAHRKAVRLFQEGATASDAVVAAHNWEGPVLKVATGD